MAKLTNTPIVELDDKIINNCYHIDLKKNDRVSHVKMSSIFEYIKKTALEDDGLTVEFTGDNIMFIKGKK